jgi:hypothetical protein
MMAVWSLGLTSAIMFLLASGGQPCTHAFFSFLDTRRRRGSDLNVKAKNSSLKQ